MSSGISSYKISRKATSYGVFRNWARNEVSPILMRRKIFGVDYTLRSHFSSSFTPGASSRVIQELLAEIEKEKQMERDSRKRAGLSTEDIDVEDNEDFMGIGPLIEKLEKEKLKDPTANLNLREEPSDSVLVEDDVTFLPENLKKGFLGFSRITSMDTLS